MMRPILTTISLLLALAVMAARADAVSERLTARIAKMFPKEKVTDITPSPVAGLYEVLLGSSLFYLSVDGRYVVHGDLIDLDGHVNLSDQRRSQARQQVFAGLDSRGYIEFPSQLHETKKTLYVFTDIDCAYCRKMHREVPQLNNAGISVRYLAFPRTGLKGPSFDKATAVWCSANRQEAITAAKLGQPVTAPKCDNPVAQEFKLGQSMGVTGTPAVYTDKGEQIGGYVPADELIKMVQEGKI